MSSFRDALAPLSVGMAREHHILHTACELPSGNGAIQSAQREILRWAQRRSGGKLPADAMAGRAFELLAAGRSSSAVEVELPEIRAWALRQEDPDKTVPGRIWTSEAIIWQTQEGAPRFAARLIVGSSEPELNIAPAAPGYIRQLIDTVGLTSGRYTLSTQPWYIASEQDQDDLLDLLEDPARRLPVIVVSARDRENPGLALNIESLAAAVCGLAYVAAILPETSWALTRKFGKKLSVFDRGIRMYMPGLDDGSDQFSHPLWLGTRLQTNADVAMAEHQIRNRVAQYSTRMVRLGEDILPFAQLRSYARKTEQDRLVVSGASDTEKLLAANNRITALAKELAEAKDMEKYALDEEGRAQRRADEAEVRERSATARVQNLLQILAANGEVEAGIPPHPETWDDFEDWCDIALVGRVVLTGAARRGCKKALYGDAGQVARCLLWLANECRQRFLEGGGPLRDATVEQGVKNSLCGSDEFTFDWQSQRLSANWHVKTGGNSRAPQNCLRIYYTWDEQTQQIVIADMPAHRRSAVS